MPLLVANGPEVGPPRFPAAAESSDEPVAVEVVREYALQNRQRFVRRHLAETESRPCLRRALHDESAVLVVKGVGVCPEPALVARREQVAELREQLVRAEPDVLVASGGLRGIEAFRLPHPAVDPVRGDNEVGVRQIRGSADLLAVLDTDAQVPRPRCQDLEQPRPADVVDLTAAQHIPCAADLQDLLLPADHGLADLPGRLRVAAAQFPQQILAERHPPAGRRVRAVPLVNTDVVAWVAELHKDRRVQAGPPPTHAILTQAPFPQRFLGTGSATAAPDT